MTSSRAILFGLMIALILAIAGACVILLPRGSEPHSVVSIAGLDPSFEVRDLLHTGRVTSLVFSPDGKYLLAGSQEIGRPHSRPQEHWFGDLKIWEVESGQEIKSIRFSQWVKTLSFSRDGKRLAVACSSSKYSAPEGFLDFVQKPGEVRIFEFPALRETAKFQFEGLVESARLAPCGKRIGVMRTHDPRTYGPSDLEIFSLAKSGTKVTLRQKVGAFTFSPDGDEVIVGQKNADAKVNREAILAAYDSRTGQLKNNIELNPSHCMEFVGDQVLVTLSNRVYSFDYKNKKHALELYGELGRWNAPEGKSLSCAAMSPDKKRIVAILKTGRDRGEVLLENLEDKVLTHVFRDESLRLNASPCAFAPDNRTFAVGTEYYRGVGAKTRLNRNEPLPASHGHVLLFTPK